MSWTVHASIITAMSGVYTARGEISCPPSERTRWPLTSGINRLVTSVRSGVGVVATYVLRRSRPQRRWGRGCSLRWWDSWTSRQRQDVIMLVLPGRRCRQAESDAVIAGVPTGAGRAIGRWPRTVRHTRRRPGRRSTSRLPVSDLAVVVTERLEQWWPPQQIAGWSRRVHPDDPEQWVPHETIYRSRFVQAKGVLNRELAGHLRTRRVMRRPRGGNSSGPRPWPDRRHGQHANGPPRLKIEPCPATGNVVIGQWQT